MKKQINVTIAQGRSVTTFFNRILENFERKFDGFPALPDQARTVPAITENSLDYLDFNAQDIIDAIANSIRDTVTPACPDITECGCSLCTENFSRTTDPGWGTSEFGPDWVGTTGLLTTGDSAVMGIGGITNGADVDDLVLALPLEMKFLWRFTGVTPDVDAEFGWSVADPLDGDIFGYISYQRDFVLGSDVSRLAAGNSFNDDDIIAAAEAPNGTWMWMAVRFSASEVKAKVWPEAGSQPDWQLTVSGSAWDHAPSQLSPFGVSATAGQNIEIGQISIYEGCCDISECSGETMREDIYYDEDSGKYPTTLSKRDTIDVYYDGLLAVRDVDYTEVEDGYIPTTISLSTVVTARYTIR